MSQADIENLKAGFDAYNDGDFERMLEFWEEDGVDVDIRLHMLFTMRAGKVARLENFGDKQEALEALGQSGE